MATKAKSSSSSCLSFLKDALLLPSKNPKLFVPVFFLVTASLLLLQITNVFCIQPRTADILHQLDEIKNMDPSSSDYAKLMAEIIKETRELVVISITLLIISFAESFARQIIAFFATSTTYAGDRYSLPELFTEVIMKGRRVRGPLITVAMVGVLNVACMLLLVALLQLAMRHMGVLYMAVLFVLPFLAFLYLNVVFFVAVAASVADADHRGVSALRLAWRLMTKVWRKEGCVLVVVVHLVATVPSPLYAVALACLKKSMPMGLALLSVYTLLGGLVQLFYYAAAMVYYYQAMESKEKEVMAHDDYVKIPTGEATTV
ncbi:hypothetical protein BDA96_10G251500 [Sorghum bicolor]|uniref:Uncharacterized protein n=2 Tax=Sorghum bicolor TaxID=4558 RepID=A0A921Q6T3_SORBI|nr:uncharacterized protein LOC8067653 [Sorghum bicolor]EER88653.1 hypothetical protein SORBI_3010G192800 [Sorghum bicolor]KAG0515115.1 hypothetical protein BDA96_10G251500 [Sorghum bicolor]|eukprot:XP_002437286.1 uncharacterized protein LOC8067653 [Sorghum bicolor]